MAIRTDFTAGEVLAAADLNDTFAAKVDYNLPVDVESGTTYTFTLANARQLVTATNASAKTFTIPPQSSVTWTANTVIRVVNYGAGAMTIDGGVGVTVTNTGSTLAQYQAAAAIRTAENAWTLVPFSGGVSALRAADVSSTTGSPAITTYTLGGIDYTAYDFTGSGSITLAKAGTADVWVNAGGGAGGWRGSRGAGGGGGGGFVADNVYLTAIAHTVVIGAGGAGNQTNGVGLSGTASRLGPFYGIGGGGGGTEPGMSGGSGGGGSTGGTGGSGTSGQGGNGGTGNNVTPSFGGGGGGGGGANGVNGTSSAGGNGGDGQLVNLTGSDIYCAGGGGGGAATGTAGTGGIGGGGNGGSNGDGGGGGVNVGGGGGGAGNINSGGASGGSGRVIIRVRT